MKTTMASTTRLWREERRRREEKESILTEERKAGDEGRKLPWKSAMRHSWRLLSICCDPVEIHANLIMLFDLLHCSCSLPHSHLLPRCVLLPAVPFSVQSSGGREALIR